MNWKPGVVYHRITLERVRVERAELIVEDGISHDEITSREHSCAWRRIRFKVNVIRDEAMSPAQVVNMPTKEKDSEET